MVNKTYRSSNGVHFVVAAESVSVGGLISTDPPLVVAIHGGTYTGKYFDIRGCSLLDRASTLGIPIAVVDRPKYGASANVALVDDSIESNAKAVNSALSDLWRENNGRSSGIFLVGHSIGGAVSILIAATQREWPLLGIAISGVGIRPPQSVADHWHSLPPLASIDVPADAKDALMYGPDGTFDVSARSNAHEADAPAPRQELQDIVFRWPSLFPEVAPKVDVPVHYRQPEFENLWVVSEQEVTNFAAQFTHSGKVDARLLRGSGHNIDFHRLGAAFQLEQLSFAIECSATGCTKRG
jgi:pimeloyl-ACP methyl ester carboxylesterase